MENAIVTALIKKVQKNRAASLKTKLVKERAQDKLEKLKSQIAKLQEVVFDLEIEARAAGMESQSQEDNYYKNMNIARIEYCSTMSQDWDSARKYDEWRRYTESKGIY
jgi:division protein CdvB (Snf7/Vps24/ESCRT-III family)